MKLLTLDVGNSSVDVCLFDGKLEYVGKFDHKNIPEVRVDYVLVSSVKPSFNREIGKIYPEAKFLSVGDVPVRTAFQVIEGAGVDRFLNIYGAVELYYKDVVIVSAGTALVVDLAVDGVFQGGFITLGIGSGLDCLSRRTELIPAFRPEKRNPVVGTNTEDAVLGGFFRQAVSFIDSCLWEWQESFNKSFKVVVTGGDGWLFDGLGYFDPLLIHRAMLLLWGVKADLLKTQ